MEKDQESVGPKLRGMLHTHVCNFSSPKDAVSISRYLDLPAGLLFFLLQPPPSSTDIRSWLLFYPRVLDLQFFSMRIRGCFLLHTDLKDDL